LEQSRPTEALPMFQTALRLHPQEVETLNNLGAAHLSLGQIDEAIATYQLAIALKPQFAEAHFNLGVALLLSGDLDRGWREYAWRARSPLEPKNKPRWDGSSLAGKTILLYPEQGMGDTIQFIRFASVLKDRGAHVLFGCPEPLIRLLQTCAGIDELLPDRAPLPPFDCYAPLLSLPGLLGVNLTTIPASVPYLSALPDLVNSWRAKLSHLKGFRVGIAWQGNPKHKGDRHRSMPLAQFEALARIEGVQLISLQQGFGSEQIAQLNDRFAVYDPGVLVDFMDSAALMSNLDLIVTVDTAIAHLAGALGLPTWVALPRVPDWRWLLNRDDSPWYPTLRLFRQEQSGEWAPTLARIAANLKQQIR